MTSPSQSPRTTQSQQVTRTTVRIPACTLAFSESLQTCIKLIYIYCGLLSPILAVMSPASIEDTTAQLLSLASELLSLTRKSPHLGYIERDSIISQYEEEYFRLSRLVNEAFRHRNS